MKVSRISTDMQEFARFCEKVFAGTGNRIRDAQIRLMIIEAVHISRCGGGLTNFQVPASVAIW